MVDTVIRLFEANSTEFTSNGLGHLPDAATCVVNEERNGEFELEMTYPVIGRRYNDISLRRIIVAKPNPYSKPQPFRIYSITTPIDGMVTINAEHISYDLSGYPVKPFSATSIITVMADLNYTSSTTAAVVNSPFIFSTDKATEAPFSVTLPCSIRSILGGSEGSILDIYGGEYEFDVFNVRLHNNRGKNRGVSIRYGKNLTDLTQEQNCSNVYTGIYPFWYSDDMGLVELPEKIVNASGSYNFDRILPLDLSGDFENAPTEDELRSFAQSYMDVANIGVPEVSLDVSFVNLAQTEDYKDYAILEEVRLCDIVNVEFPELNVSATAKCVSTTYNVLAGRYESLTLGESRTDLADTISVQAKAIEYLPTQSRMEQAISRSNKLITGGLGGTVILHSSSGGNRPDEILILDSDDPNWKENPDIGIWRFNRGGLGHSSNGYNGDFKIALTRDGHIAANRLDSGDIESNLTISGVIRTKNGNVQIDSDGIKIHNKGVSTMGDTGDDQMAVAYSNELVLSINKDATYAKKVSIGTEHRIHSLLTEEPSDWKTNYKSYYTRSGDEGSYVYTPVSDAPTWQENTYYEMVSSAEGTEYRKLSSQPSDWLTNYRNYYTQSGDEGSYVYTPVSEAPAWTVNTYYKFVYTLLNSQPDDWSSSYFNYYTRSGSAGSYVYEHISSVPTWQTNKYYALVSVAGGETYELLTSEPDDWSSSYFNYYIRSGSAGSYTYDSVPDADAPIWQSNTYYRDDYALLTSQPDDWLTGYFNYYSVTVEGDWRVYENVSAAPTWQDGMYYDKLGPTTKKEIKPIATFMSDSQGMYLVMTD